MTAAELASTAMRAALAPAFDVNPIALAKAAAELVSVYDMADIHVSGPQAGDMRRAVEALKDALGLPTDAEETIDDRPYREEA